jgi:hypothetical protein
MLLKALFTHNLPLTSLFRLKVIVSSHDKIAHHDSFNFTLLTGMEWDRVMVLSVSLKDLSQYKIVTPVTSSPSKCGPISQACGFKAASKLCDIDGSSSAQLDWLSYRDHYNIWYVDLTRAKKVLLVPPKFMKLLE